MFDHGFGSSMVLLEIDAESISGIEFKSDAPRPVDVNRVPGRKECFLAHQAASGDELALRISRGNDVMRHEKRVRALAISYRL
jgi:hypothetical protein